MLLIYYGSKMFLYLQIKTSKMIRKLKVGANGYSPKGFQFSVTLVDLEVNPGLNAVSNDCIVHIKYTTTLD
jgi:hypothetical protein